MRCSNLTDTVLKDLLQIEQLINDGNNNKALELVRKISKREGLPNEDKYACILLESRINLNLGEKEKALIEAEKIWPVIIETENLLLILDYLIIKIQISLELGEFDNGIKIIEGNLDLITKLQSKVPKNTLNRFKNRKNFFLRLSGILYWYRGDLDTSLEFHKQCLILGEEVSNKTSILDSFNNIGLVYSSKSDFDKAIEYYNRALDIAEELDLNRKRATILSNLGNAYSIKGDLDRALDVQLQSLEIRKKYDYKQDIAISLINVGVILQFQGEIERSLDYYQQALQISEEVNSKNNIALSLNNIGNIFDLRGNFEEALGYFERSLKIYKELGIKEKIALLLSNIGCIHRQKGNIEEAIDRTNQSLEIYEEMGNNFGVSVALLELVQGALDQNNQELAQEYLNKLQQVSKSANVPSINQRFRLAQAFSLKSGTQSRNHLKATVIFEQIIEEEIVDYSLTVKAMIHLCDMLIQELKQSAVKELLDQIKGLLHKLQEIAEEQASNSILVETYRLEALLALAELDLQATRQLLQKGFALAEEIGLESIASNILEEQKELEEQIKLWEELQDRQAPLEETLQYVKIEETMKQLKQEETVTHRKLFSLKI